MSEIFSIRLKALMKENKMSLRELQIKSGIPHASIQRYTHRSDNVPLSRVALLAKALDVTPEYLIGLSDDRIPNPRPEEMNELFRKLSIQEQDLIIAQVKGILASRED